MKGAGGAPARRPRRRAAAPPARGAPPRAPAPRAPRWPRRGEPRWPPSRGWSRGDRLGRRVTGRRRRGLSLFGRLLVGDCRHARRARGTEVGQRLRLGREAGRQRLSVQRARVGGSSRAGRRARRREARPRERLCFSRTLPERRRLFAVCRDRREHGARPSLLSSPMRARGTPAENQVIIAPPGERVRRRAPPPKAFVDLPARARPLDDLLRSPRDRRPASTDEIERVPPGRARFTRTQRAGDAAKAEARMKFNDPATSPTGPAAKRRLRRAAAPEALRVPPSAAPHRPAPAAPPPEEAPRRGSALSLGGPVRRRLRRGRPCGRALVSSPAARAARRRPRARALPSAGGRSGCSSRPCRPATPTRPPVPRAARPRGRGVIRIGLSAHDVLRVLGLPGLYEPGPRPGESVLRFGTLRLEMKTAASPVMTRPPAERPFT